ncbi:hypothetical protein AVEN_237205-1 [Araneus ventricosus]|uniref:Uncharacterized protein n=1 Tax=Araneus ventricosus TaxID=182803 RepID=A0A4Y2FDY6_ARAVE|nr:hypothetical protein AVEN_237205-1 [Araneus ventricosus]
MANFSSSAVASFRSHTKNYSAVVLISPIESSLKLPGGRCGLRVKSRLSAGGFQVRNPIPLKIRLYVDLLKIHSYVGDQTSSRWCGATQPSPPYWD